MRDNYPLIFIVGPTAVGKTEVAVELAERISAEIISCDSMLIYREPQILVNKPEDKILRNIKHYMIGIISVEEEFDVYKFKKEVDSIITQYPQKNFIFVGGSGLYIKVLLDGIFDEGGSSEELRQVLLREAQERGISFLYQKLRKLDPQASLKINPNDLRRIVRALEVYYLSKKPISLRQKEAKGYWGKFPIRIFGLFLDRKILYQRINQRAEEMFKRGALEEVRFLSNLKLSKTAQKILGIKEIEGFFQGRYDLDEAKELLKKNTRHFAKRQYTWFKKDKRVEWIDIQGLDPQATVLRIFNRLSEIKD